MQLVGNFQNYKSFPYRIEFMKRQSPCLNCPSCKTNKNLEPCRSCQKPAAYDASYNDGLFSSRESVSAHADKACARREISHDDVKNLYSVDALEKIRQASIRAGQGRRPVKSKWFPDVNPNVEQIPCIFEDCGEVTNRSHGMCPRCYNRTSTRLFRWVEKGHGDLAEHLLAPKTKQSPPFTVWPDGWIDGILDKISKGVNGATS